MKKTTIYSLCFLLFMAMLWSCKQSAQHTPKRESNDDLTEANTLGFKNDSLNLTMTEVQKESSESGSSSGERLIQYKNQSLKKIIQDLGAGKNLQVEIPDGYNKMYHFELKLSENISPDTDIRQVALEGIVQLLELKKEVRQVNQEVWMLTVAQPNLLKITEEKDTQNSYTGISNQQLTLSNQPLSGLCKVLAKQYEDIFVFEGEDNTHYDFKQVPLGNIASLQKELKETYGMELIKTSKNVSQIVLKKS